MGFIDNIIRKGDTSKQLSQYLNKTYSWRDIQVSYNNILLTGLRGLRFSARYNRRPIQNKNGRLISNKVLSVFYTGILSVLHSDYELIKAVTDTELALDNKINVNEMGFIDGKDILIAFTTSAGRIQVGSLPSSEFLFPSVKGGSIPKVKASVERFKGCYFNSEGWKYNQGMSHTIIELPFRFEKYNRYI